MNRLLVTILGFTILFCSISQSVYCDVVAYFKFDDGAVGDTALLPVDSGPNNLVAVAGKSGAVPIPKYDFALQSGLSLKFQGGPTDPDASYVQVTDPGASPLDLTGPHTIEAYIRPTQIKDGIIVRKMGGLGGNDGGLGGYSLALHDSGRVRYTLFDDDFTAVSNTVLETGKTYHIGATWDGSIMRLYINHVLDAVFAYNGALLATNSKFGIGAILRDSGTIGQGFSGRIDAVRISNEALGPEDFLVMTDATAGADAYTLIRGRPGSGVLSNTYKSDNSYLQFLAAPAMGLGPRIWVEFEGALPTDNPTTLGFTLEAGATVITFIQRIELYNFDTGLFELIDKRASTLIDTVIEKDATGDIGRFVEDGTGKVRGRVIWERSPGVLATARIDQLIWSMTK